MSLRQSAHALGTDASRFSYGTGKVAPSAAFLLRAERIADALADARRDGIPTSIDASASIRRAARKGDDDWTYALALKSRDRRRDVLRRRRELAAAWEAQPPSIGERWNAHVGALVSPEFDQTGLPTPRWSNAVPAYVETPQEELPFTLRGTVLIADATPPALKSDWCEDALEQMQCLSRQLDKWDKLSRGKTFALPQGQAAGTPTCTTIPE